MLVIFLSSSTIDNANSIVVTASTMFCRAIVFSIVIDFPFIFLLSFLLFIYIQSLCFILRMFHLLEPLLYVNHSDLSLYPIWSVRQTTKWHGQATFSSFQILSISSFIGSTHAFLLVAVL